MKTCNKCGVIRNDDAFRMTISRGAPYQRTTCKECDYKAYKEWRALNPGKIKAIKTREYIKNKETILSKQKKYRSENSGKVTARERANKAKWRNDNRIKYLERSRAEHYKYCDGLLPVYLRKIARLRGYTKGFIEDHPEILEIIKYSIKINRYVKQKANDQ